MGACGCGDINPTCLLAAPNGCVYALTFYVGCTYCREDPAILVDLLSPRAAREHQVGRDEFLVFVDRGDEARGVVELLSVAGIQAELDAQWADFDGREETVEFGVDELLDAIGAGADRARRTKVGEQQEHKPTTAVLDALQRCHIASEILQGDEPLDLATSSSFFTPAEVALQHLEKAIELLEGIKPDSPSGGEGGLAHPASPSDVNHVELIPPDPVSAGWAVIVWQLRDGRLQGLLDLRVLQRGGVRLARTDAISLGEILVAHYGLSRDRLLERDSSGNLVPVSEPGAAAEP